MHVRLSRQTGFSLVEMSIVLLIAGLLVAGAWQLTRSMQQQRSDQATANEMRVVVAAINQMLQDRSADLDAAISAPIAPATLRASLLTDALDIDSSPTAILPARTFFRDHYLPPNFPLGASITDGYGIAIGRMQNLNGRPVFRALVIRTPDSRLDTARRSRVASLVGSQGGIVASTTEARGVLGSWQVSPTAYGFTTGIDATTQIAAYTTTVDNQINTNLLSRVNTGNPEANTMRTDLIMADANSATEFNDIQMGLGNVVSTATGIGFVRTLATAGQRCDTGGPTVEMLQNDGSGFTPTRNLTMGPRFENVTVMGFDTLLNQTLLQCRRFVIGPGDIRWIWTNVMSTGSSRQWQVIAPTNNNLNFSVSPPYPNIRNRWIRNSTNSTMQVIYNLRVGSSDNIRVWIEDGTPPYSPKKVLDYLAPGGENSSSITFDVDPGQYFCVDESQDAQAMSVLIDGPTPLNVDIGQMSYNTGFVDWQYDFQPGTQMVRACQ